MTGTDREARRSASRSDHRSGRQVRERSAPRAAWLAAAAVLGLCLAASQAVAQESRVAELRAAARAAPADAAASLALGKALRRAGRLPEAATELHRGALLGSALKAGLTSPIRYELARTRIDQREVKLALAACASVSPRALSLACRADAYLSQNRAHEAMPEVEKALAASPGLYEAKVAEGRSLALMGKLAEAEAALREAVGRDESRAEAHHRLGVFLASRGQREPALAALARAKSADPHDADIAFAIGEVLGETREGADSLASAARIRPAFAEAHALHALASLALADVAAAEASAATAVKLDPKHPPAQIALGRVHNAQKRWDEGRAAGEAARKLIPNLAAAELLIADAYAGKGDIDLAVESYQKAHGLDRTDVAPLVRAANACLAAGRLTTAKGFADKSTSEFPKWGPGWVALGEVNERLKEPARARTAFERALKSEGPVDAEAVRRKLAALR